MRIMRRKSFYVCRFLRRNLLLPSYCCCRWEVIIVIVILLVLTGIIVAIAIAGLYLHANFVFIWHKNNELYLDHQRNMNKVIRPEGDEVDNVWIRISDDVHIYSAYLDTREMSRPRLLNDSSSQYALIRIIGILKVPPMREVIKEDPFKWLRIKDEADLSHQYGCKTFIYSPNGQKVVLSEGNILTRFIFEEGIKVFAGTFFNCYINLNRAGKLIGSDEDVYVAMYPVNEPGYPDKPLRVMIKKETTIKYKLSVCIRPLFGQESFGDRLSQFISYYRGMGVEEFNFYELSISPEVRKALLTAYEGISVSLRKWNLPTGNTSELWDFGSLAALNDCLYRNMGMGRHVLFVDIDEFIVPQGKSRVGDLRELIKVVGIFHELRVRNTFFCKEFCESNDIRKCVIRTKRIWSGVLRTKFLVKPESVLSVGHHGVTAFTATSNNDLGPGRRRAYLAKYSKVVSKDLALMNHYRECRSLGEPKTLARRCVKDTTILGHLEKMKKLKLITS